MDVKKILFKLGLIPFMVRMKSHLKKLIEFYDILIGNKLSKRQIKKIISRHYKNSKVEVISKVNSNQQQIFYISYKNEDKIIKCYFKAFIGNASEWSANLDNLFERELTSLKILNYYNCPVPKLILSGKEKKIPWIITENIEGRTIESLGIENIEKINPVKLAELLFKIHSTDISINIKDKSLTCFDEYYIKNELSKIVLLCDIDTIFIDELIKIVNKCKETSELVFCHGDFHDGNILLDLDGNFYAIDFEDAIIGYRQYDLGEIGYHLIKSYGEEIYQRFLDAYMEISKCSFDSNLYRDIHDFIDIKNIIIGIFLLKGGYKHKYPFTRHYIRDEKKARKDLNDVLDKRQNY